MSKKLLISSALGLAVAMTPLASIAGMGAEENINIYGWQNWSYEFVDADGDAGKDYDRLSNNAANIGFISHMETGIDGLQVGFRCEQFTFWGRNNNSTQWCNRNSKISLRHETLGEIMFGQWLLPYNEIVAAWVDPFYDAGADSHTSIMGNVGRTVSVGQDRDDDFSGAFYNGGLDADFGSAFGALSFNRRQEGIIQYIWPSTAGFRNGEGFQFRFAVTEGSATDVDGGEARNGATVDPRIYSTGVSYQKNLANGDQAWFAVAYEKHEDLSITDIAQGIVVTPATVAVPTVASTCEESDDDAFRVAGRYIRNWGNGMKTQFAVMWEELDYEFDGCRGNTPIDDANDPRNGFFTGLASPALTGDNDVDGNPNRYDSGVERDAWMISGIHTFGNSFDFRFSYMDADELDCDTLSCANTAAAQNRYENESDADAYNVGLFYTMPAGTELRLTYSEIQNEDYAGYDFGISPGGVQVGEDIEMLAVGIVHWFD